MNEHKHTYLGEHKGKANILLSSTVDDVFSITLEDEQNEVKSSWEMTMYRDDAEKVARKFGEMLGVIPIYDCRSCKNNGNERYCLDCHDYCNFVRYEARPQGEYIRKEDVIALLNKWADGYSYIEIPTEDAIKEIMEFNPKGNKE